MIMIPGYPRVLKGDGCSQDLKMKVSCWSDPYHYRSAKSNIILVKRNFMIGKLSPSEIEDVLSLQCVGRIGCHDKDNIYVVPISYAYDGENIYCHAYEGKKIELMRTNPGVCFEVDEMKDMANWKSVILQGQFEEIKEKKERDKALEILVNRRLPISSSITTHLGQTWPFVGDGFKGLSDIPGIVFRISIREKTGRFEKTTVTPLESA
jgi:hypothetical protein